MFYIIIIIWYNINNTNILYNNIYMHINSNILHNNILCNNNNNNNGSDDIHIICNNSNLL